MKSKSWAVIARLLMLLIASGWLLWRLAEMWRGHPVLLPAAGLAAFALTTLYLVGRAKHWPSRSTVWAWAAPFGTLALVFFLTSSAWHVGQYEKEALARAAFDRDVNSAQFALANRIRRYSDFLALAEPRFRKAGGRSNGADALFMSDLMRTEYPAIAALGLLEETAGLRENEDVGEKTAVSDEAPTSYRLRTLPEASRSCDGSVDLPTGSRVARLMARAAVENSTVVSNKLFMDCGSGLQDYVLLVRHSAGPSESPNWHGALVLPAQLLNSPWRNGEQQLDYVVSENPGFGSDTLLYWAGGSVSGEPAWFRRDMPLEFAGTTWTVRFRSRDSFETAFDQQGINDAPWYGVVLGFVALGLVWSFTQERKGPGASATDSAVSETQACAQAVLDHTTDGILAVDEQGLVRSLNPAARGAIWLP